MPVQSKYLAASRVHVLPLHPSDFESFLNHLQCQIGASKQTLAEYRKVWEGWRTKADAKGVVSIPKEELGMELIRILTGTCCGNAESVAEDIADGETGIMLGGRAFIHPRAGQPILPPGKMWYVFHFTPAVKGHAAKPAIYTPQRQVVSEKLSIPKNLWDELNWQDRLVPHGEWALVIEGTAIAPMLVKREENTLHKLAELRGLGTGFLVTTMVTENKAKKRDQWIKVGMFLPLSQAALAHVPQLAADLRALLPWLHLDKAINVSVRMGDPNGLITKNHTGGYEAVRKIAPAMAQKFGADGKGVAWKIPCDDLPIPSPEMEFEAVVAAYNKPEPTAEPKSEPKPRQVLSSEDIRALMGGNWADDTDDEELEPFQPPSVAKAEPAEAPSVAEPVAKAEPAKAPSVAEPVAKAKTKTRRGGAAARKRRQRAQE